MIGVDSRSGYLDLSWLCKGEIAGNLRQQYKYISHLEPSVHSETVFFSFLFQAKSINNIGEPILNCRKLPSAQQFQKWCLSREEENKYGDRLVCIFFFFLDTDIQLAGLFTCHLLNVLCYDSNSPPGEAKS